MKSRSFLSLTISLGALALGSSKGPQEIPHGPPEVGIPYVKSIYAMPVTFDPSQMNEANSQTFAEAVYEGLLRLDGNLVVSKGLASEWQVGPDGKVFTFTLHKGAKFHNGRPVQARDVVYSLQRNLAPKSRVVKQYDIIEGGTEFFQGKAPSVSGIKALGPHTVEIKLKNRFPPFVFVLAGHTAKVFPEGYFETKLPSDRPIGAGAFEVEKILKDRILLRAFRGYHGNPPRTQKLILRASKTQQEAIELAEQGEVHDLSSWPLQGQEDIFKKGSLIPASQLETWIIGLNSQKRPLMDPKVRRSFRKSFDSEKFRKTFYPSALPSSGVVPKGLVNSYSPSEGGPSQDPLGTSEDISSDLIKIAVPQELAQGKEVAQFIEREFGEKGWPVEVILVSWEGLLKGMKNQSFHGFLVSLQMEYPDIEFILNYFQSDNPENFFGIKDQEVDRLLAASKEAPDRGSRMNILKEAYRRVDSLDPTINLFHPMANHWVHRCVRGFNVNIVGIAYVNYRDYWVDKECLENAR